MLARHCLSLAFLVCSSSCYGAVFGMGHMYENAQTIPDHATLLHTNVRALLT